MQPDVDAGLFLEYADVHGNMYGTSLAAVAAVGRSGRIAVLDIDVQVRAGGGGGVCYRYTAEPGNG